MAEATRNDINDLESFDKSKFIKYVEELTNENTTYENASDDSKMIHTFLHTLIYPNIDKGYNKFVAKHYSTRDIDPPTTKEIQQNLKISLEGICFVYFIMMVDGWNKEALETNEETVTRKKRGRKVGDKAISNKKDMDLYVKQCKKIKSTRNIQLKESWYVEGMNQAMQEYESKLETNKDIEKDKDKSSSDEDEADDNEELNFDGFKVVV